MHLHFDHVPIVCIMPGGVLGHVFALQKLHQVLVEAVHSFVDRRFNMARQEDEVIAGDAVLDSHIAFHDFKAGNALAERAGNQPLADDRVQTCGPAGR